jgi:hypothetical protein
MFLAGTFVWYEIQFKDQWENNDCYAGFGDNNIFSGYYDNPPGVMSYVKNMLQTLLAGTFAWYDIQVKDQWGNNNCYAGFGDNNMS